MTAANKITLVRIAMIPVFVVTVLSNFKYSDLLALIIFALASLTDGVDGYVARRYNQVTKFGKFIDPLADKLLITAAILIFVERGQMPSWVAILIIAREFAVTSLRLVAVGGGIVIGAGLSGKIKTFVSIIAICIMLTPISAIEIIPGVLTVNTVVVAATLIVTAWSGIDYFYKNYKLLDIKS